MPPLVFANDAPTVVERFRDASGVALIALLLGIPMIGLTTADQGGALQVLTRWPLLAAFIAASFCGRLAVRYLLDALKRRRQVQDRQAGAAAAQDARRGGRMLELTGWLAFGLALVLPIVFSDNRYVVDTATTVLIYVMLGWGLNVVVGLAGLLDLGHVAFYAVGAYAYALLSTQFGGGF